jgi:hypothetical protein
MRCIYGKRSMWTCYVRKMGFYDLEEMKKEEVEADENVEILPAHTDGGWEFFGVLSSAQSFR